MGVRVVVYIDNLLVLARSQEESLRHTQLLEDTLHHFGFSVHPDKIQAVPIDRVLGHPGELRTHAISSP